MAGEEGKAAAAMDERMFLEAERLASFTSWPFNNRYRCKPKNLAAAGFFFVGGTDTVQCFMCGKQLSDWERSDNPMEEHKSHSPKCPFVNLQFEDNRALTFKLWPHTDYKASARDFARAGFIHVPTPDSADLVKCFTCGKTLDGWEADDDPVEEHAAHSKKCSFVSFLREKRIKDDKASQASTATKSAGGKKRKAGKGGRKATKRKAAAVEEVEAAETADAPAEDPQAETDAQTPTRSDKPQEESTPPTVVKTTKRARVSVEPEEVEEVEAEAEAEQEEDVDMTPTRDNPGAGVIATQAKASPYCATKSVILSLSDPEVADMTVDAFVKAYCQQKVHMLIQTGEESIANFLAVAKETRAQIALLATT